MKRVIILFALSLAISNVAYPGCRMEPRYTEEGLLYYDEVCEATYYEEMAQEPNWCTYDDYDGVYLRFNSTQIVGYYAVRAGDYSTAPPEGYHLFRFTIYHHPFCSYWIF